MQWGFGWELGPFELFDAIGVQQVVEAWRAQPSDGGDLPPLVTAALSTGRNRFRDGPVAPAAADLQILRSAREQSKIVRRNAGASLVDLGDGVLCVEFHSKMNAIGGDTLEMLQAGVAEAERNFAALVVGNDAPNFSAGANLMLLLLEAQEGNWDEIDLMVRSFQRATTSLRHAQVPVVAAPAGLALGGGCEVVAARRPRAGGRGDLRRAGRGRRRVDPGRRREPRRCWRVPWTGLPATRRPAAVRATRVRNHRVREGLDERPRRSAHRLPA